MYAWLSNFLSCIELFTRMYWKAYNSWDHPNLDIFSIFVLVNGHFGGTDLQNVIIEFAFINSMFYKTITYIWPYQLLAHTNHVTSSKPADTLICHATMCRNAINILYIPGHMTLWQMEVIPVVYTSDVVSWKNANMLVCDWLNHQCVFNVLLTTVFLYIYKINQWIYWLWSFIKSIHRLQGVALLYATGSSPLCNSKIDVSKHGGNFREDFIVKMAQNPGILCCPAVSPCTPVAPSLCPPLDYLLWEPPGGVYGPQGSTFICISL